MREIKFRAWDTDTNQMRDNDWLCLGDYDAWPPLIFALTKQDTGYKLMQFTGLRDKNGKEIYEGDVVEGQKDYYPRSVIGFEDGSFVLHKADLANWKVNHFQLEVIGNIYENPELMV